jgi:hypothetical protein
VLLQSQYHGKVMGQLLLQAVVRLLFSLISTFIIVTNVLGQFELKNYYF